MDKEDDGDNECNPWRSLTMDTHSGGFPFDPFFERPVLTDEVDARTNALRNVASSYRNTNPSRVPQLHDKVARLINPNAKPELFYKIKGSTLKGRAVIVNIKSFTGEEEKRQGSDLDATNMLAALETLGFAVEVYENLTRDRFYDLIHSLTTDPKKIHTNVDMFIMVVLSHGTQDQYKHDVIMSSDSEEMPFKYITSQFEANIAKTLAGKPKLFFVQACRGAKTDIGREVFADAMDGHGDGDLVGGGEDEADFFYRTITIPAEADIFVAYSTPPGYYSWRSPESGSYFMQLLSYRLFQNGYRENCDLNTIMTLVSHDLVSFQSNVPQNQDMHRKKQVPWISSTLTKRLKFKPT